MENKEMVMGIALEKFSWKIESFSKVSTKRLSSKALKIGGYYNWKIVLDPMGDNVNHFSLSIEIADGLRAYGWKIYAYFRVALINQFETKNSIVKETQQKFIGENRSWNSPSFISLNEFLDPSKGYLVNDTCIIEAQIAISKDVAFDILDNVELKEPEQQLGVALKDNRKGKQKIESPDENDHSSETGECSQMGKEVQSSDLTLRDILDFDKLGDEEKTYFSLLQEVCVYHPSLITSLEKNSDLFKVWAFISLGKVLHILNTIKVRDMDEDAWNQLCILWKELIKSSGFDLAWLEPQVHDALGVKAQVERTLALKNLENGLVDIKIKKERLKEELAAIKAEFKVARKTLIDARKGFTKIDSDVVLGYSMF